MQYDIITYGIPMVEMTRTRLDVPLNLCGEFAGPFPAGDPGILLNACVKLGCAGAYAGVVGEDDFGACFLECMERNHVDTTHIRSDSMRATGMSFVANFSDGSRKFVFQMASSAAASLGPADFDQELLERVKWIHVSGFALSVSESIADLHRMIMERISDKVMVSFDPNFRKDIIDQDTFVKRCLPVYKRCNLYLPSMGEAGLFGEAEKSLEKETENAVSENVIGENASCGSRENIQSRELEACRKLAARGKLVVLKDGSAGAYGFSDGLECFIPSFGTEEKDPTGAGDTFGGAVIASLLNGMEFTDCIRNGCAAGAIAVKRVGLMDIAPTWEEIKRVVADGCVLFA